MRAHKGGGAGQRSQVQVNVTLLINEHSLTALSSAKAEAKAKRCQVVDGEEVVLATVPVYQSLEEASLAALVGALRLAEVADPKLQAASRSLARTYTL